MVFFIKHTDFCTGFCNTKNWCNKFITPAKFRVKMYAKMLAFLEIEYNTNRNIYSIWRYLMDFIKPKNDNKENIFYKISRKTKLIVKYYAKYTEYQEDEVVDMFLQNILKDSDFVEWLNSRRSKKKINEIIFGINSSEEATKDTTDVEENDF